MFALKVMAYTSADGFLKLEIPTEFHNQSVTVTLVIEENNSPNIGWPVGYFEETYGIIADEPMTRGDL